MKKKNLKSILGLLFMSVLLTVFAPSDILAQTHQKEDKVKTKQKAKPNKNQTKAQTHQKEDKVKTEQKAKPSKNQTKAQPQTVNRAQATTPVKHYSKQPRRGAQVTVLPKNTVVVNHQNMNYHYRDGIFYRPVNGTYIVAAPPIGIHVSVLPPNPFRVVVLGYPYYYYYGTYYVDGAHGGYDVVDAPIGAIIDALPEGYEVFELDDKVYYRLDETYYKAVLEANGNVAYEVVRI